jgi:hypothetical protein
MPENAADSEESQVPTRDSSKGIILVASRRHSDTNGS